MPAARVLPFQPRKTPQQGRSIATVEAIHKATIQVLLKSGSNRLTTVRVARRAGVSVGTLYQYFPNKQALLFAVLERHMGQVLEAVEKACLVNRSEPLEVMMEELVNRFIDAKLTDRATSVALYNIASEVGGSMVVDRARVRAQAAILLMLETAKLPPSADLRFMAHMLHTTMAGILRGHLESNAPLHRTRKLRAHLAALAIAYCRAVGTP